MTWWKLLPVQQLLAATRGQLAPLLVAQGWFHRFLRHGFPALRAFVVCVSLMFRGHVLIGRSLNGVALLFRDYVLVSPDLLLQST